MSIPYTCPLWYHERVSKLSGALAERSKISGCSVSTVCRIDKKSAENGTIIDKSPPSNTRGMNKAMNEKESACLLVCHVVSSSILENVLILFEL